MQCGGLFSYLLVGYHVSASMQLI